MIYRAVCPYHTLLPHVPYITHFMLHFDGRSVRLQAESKQILDAKSRFEYAHFCASELYLAVADGLTMRTLKVCVCLKTSAKCSVDVSCLLR